MAFMFTDIEGSTRLMSALGPAFPDLHAEHQREVRMAIQAAGGRQVSTEGDAFFAVFATAPQAIRAAASIQRALAGHPWPAEAEIRVRIGVHTGYAVATSGDYLGLEVNRAARIAAAGHGGQILVSDVAKAEASGSEPPDTAWRDLGRHRLKDIGVERLWQLDVAGLPARFPALRSLEEQPTNLPAEATSLVDREDEVATLVGLVAQHPLVTLTGPGGIGKSRIALRAAREMLERFGDGVFHLDLARFDRAGDVGAELWSVLGLRPPAPEDPVARLVEHLRDRELLLVLETPDRVTGIAELLAGIGVGARRSRIVVTARGPLHLAAERELQVAPLATEGRTDGRAAGDASIATSPAVALFVARARAVRPGFEPDESEFRTVAEICRRLDGLPLAIELAAARIRLLPLPVLLERLALRLPLLTSGAVDAPDRQRTLRSAIAWSYELLDPAEQRVLQRLAVFVGAFDLAAAEAVADLSEASSLDVLERLVDRSLLVVTDDGSERRFHLLGTIREFALEALVQAGGFEEARANHASYWLDVARAEAPRLTGPDDTAAVVRLERSLDEIRAALDWALGGARAPGRDALPVPGSPADPPGAALALELAADIGRFLWLRGHPVEGASWLDRALAGSPNETSAVRARALFWSGVLHDDAGRPEIASERLEACLAMQRELGDEPGVARALNSLGVVARSLGDLDRAEALLRESLDRKRGLGLDAEIASTLNNLAIVADDRGDLATAARALEEALVLDRIHGGHGPAAYSLANLGAVWIRMDRVHEGVAVIREALRVIAELDDADAATESFDHLAEGALRAGDPLLAARLSLMARAIRKRAGLPEHGSVSRRARETLDQIRRALDETTIENLETEADALGLADAIAVAVGEPR
jgi:predicted ATPase/class 3 adenylate cyclase